jgi:WS/DGAT/MGAT family acyltransferase
VVLASAWEQAWLMPAAARLSALDATFLELEQADEAAHMHIGGVLVFDPLPGGGAPSFEAVARLLDSRLDALPRYRERLSEAHVHGLQRPRWELDPRFALEAHVRRAALPPPGGETELLAWAAGYYGQRLSRFRPLWELTLLEGLDGGRWALCTKVHHCLVDGVGSVDAGMVMLDRTPDPPAAPPLPWRPPAGERRDGLDALLGAAAHPLRSLDRSRALIEMLARDELKAAAGSSLNVPIGPRRRLVVTRARLGDLRAIGHALGGTVNDVALALVTSGLRELLLARGEQPPTDGLRAMVPVNVRRPGDARSAGNRVSSLFVTLPVAEPAPLARLHLIRRETAAAKRGRQALGADTWVALAEHAPPVLHTLATRTTLGTRLFNLTVTNVPGPAVPLYALGGRLREMIPIVPLAAGHAVGVAILSYDGGVVLCANCDEDTVPDAARLAAGMGSARDELARLTRRRPLPARA